MKYTEYKGGRLDGKFWHAHFTHNDTLLTIRPENDGYAASVTHGVYALADYCLGRIPESFISAVWEGKADSLDAAIDLVFDAYHKGLTNSGVK